VVLGEQLDAPVDEVRPAAQAVQLIEPSSEKNPARHSVQEAAPPTENVPEGHSEQLPALGPEYMPKMQRVQLVDPGKAANCPAEHSMQAASELNLPTGQVVSVEVHSEAPTPEVLPTSQSVQYIAPVIDEYIPEVHAAQANIPENEFDWPGGQSLHVAKEVAPVVLENFPASHFEQVAVVDASENEPAGQVVHTSPERYLPAAQVVDGLEVQFVGLDAPVVGVEVPDGHAVQLVCPVLSP